MTKIALIPFLPLLGFFINILLGRKFLKDRAHLVSVPLVGISMILAIMTVLEVTSGNVINKDLYTWVVSGDFKVSVGFLIDQLTAVMLVVVTVVSFLVHVYSIGYMHGDPGFYRFFAYLNLFTFSMLMLIMSNNFLQLYFGWEAVGLCSYLLIGYWYEKKSASDAGKKAFIVNRFGDFGFGLGVILIFLTFGTLHYAPVFENVSSIAEKSITLFGQEIHLITLIALLLFCGAIGKSAQIPLHVWLPDAMEGPTPVSALIHAATMVTAGVFMVARCNPIFNLSETAMMVVAITGAVTALFAATIGLVQNDIKRIIAYSTVSQLGYMFLACGVGAYGAGIFHLYTHAFFKALLFLGAGSVMHAMAGELDIWKMGGLKNKLRITYITMLLASLSISGIPGFAGFFSKDEILYQAYLHGEIGKILWFIGTITALLTAFYSFRIIAVAFHGRFRGTHEQEHHLHESPPVMTIPLILLAIGAVGAGWIGIPPLIGEALGLHGTAWFYEFLAPVLGHPHSEGSHSAELMVMTLSIIVGIGGIALAFYLYSDNGERAKALLKRPLLKKIYTMLWNKYYVDEFYQLIIVRPTLWVARTVVEAVTDIGIIEAVVNGVPSMIGRLSTKLRAIQTGLVNHYAIFMVGAMFFILAFILIAR
ncbi:MAG: NADH-quinone oxidoreductase subunit L [Thermodesulfovibrionales bacterium]|nr:NADH-quinone oxidoreductase subunit L [Thermodesulfovibrionales bacterium]